MQTRLRYPAQPGNGLQAGTTRPFGMTLLIFRTTGGHGTRRCQRSRITYGN
jgi:hypothetical protein